ncbi:MAG: hypothetical protein M1832_003997 [Thelocarpon impressellum]|nr:MAG: hypothetical protein M1832_003997 [Thelocarpon impressellum]
METYKDNCLEAMESSRDSSLPPPPYVKWAPRDGTSADAAAVKGEDSRWEWAILRQQADLERHNADVLRYNTDLVRQNNALLVELAGLPPLAVLARPEAPAPASPASASPVSVVVAPASPAPASLSVVVAPASPAPASPSVVVAPASPAPSPPDGS